MSMKCSLLTSFFCNEVHIVIRENRVKNVLKPCGIGGRTFVQALKKYFSSAKVFSCHNTHDLHSTLNYVTYDLQLTVSESHIHQILA